MTFFTEVDLKRLEERERAGVLVLRTVEELRVQLGRYVSSLNDEQAWMEWCKRCPEAE